MASTSTLPPFFSYQNEQLMVEAVSLSTLAQQYGTPLFVYSKASIVAALDAYTCALGGRDHMVCYAMKANSSLAVLQIMLRAGCGVDIVSGGELERALAVGFAPEKIIFSGVGKTRIEMQRALEVGIGCFNVESRAEIEVLNEVAQRLQLRAPVSLRVNPDVDAKTHPYISTGLKNNKFGIAHQEALQTYRYAATCPGLRIVGIDCHIGSQLTQIEPYLDSTDRIVDLVQAIETDGIALEHLDFGGGLGIDYRNGDAAPPSAYALWQRILRKLDERGYGHKKILIEPGRSLVGNAGACVTEVLYLKPSEHKNFLIVDAAMNDLPRPAMYQAFHPIVPLNPRSQISTNWDVVGPVCESGDWLGRDRPLATQAGDLLAILCAGAYCMSMASNYNTRGRAAEVLVDGSNATLIRSRESAADLMHHEMLLPL